MKLDQKAFDTRKTTLNGWYRLPVGELVTTLEVGEYTPPMQRDHDSLHIVDHLWKVHRLELTPTIRERLSLLKGSEKLSAAAESQLDAYLTALDGNRDELLKSWHSLRAKVSEMNKPWEEFQRDKDNKASYERWSRRNFDYLIEVVETPKWLFGWAKMAIVFLGKLDAARGSRAAQVIRSRVYDSADSVIALRDRVLSRLESASSWRTCPDCCFGLIHSRATGFPEPCQYCLGLGLLQSTG